MNLHALCLLAQSTRTYYELARLQSMHQWWHWMLLGVVCALIVAWITVLYWRDTDELARGKRWLLLSLRVMAFVGLLIFFLQIEKRSEQKLVKNSRLLVLIDTSQSMGLVDAESGSAAGSQRRIDPLVAELEGGTLLDDLRQKHDVTVYRFDQSDRPVEVAALAKRGPPRDSAGVAVSSQQRYAASLREARVLLAVVAVLLAIAGVGVAANGLLGWYVRSAEGQSWALLVSAMACVMAVITLAIGNLRNPDITLTAALGGSAAATPAAPVGSAPPTDLAAGKTPPATAPVPWKARLMPRGSKTRLGDAVRFLVDKNRGGPVAAVVVISDGRNNAGIDCGTAVDLSADAGIALYTVGMGSDQLPRNVRVVDVKAPPRVYPGDPFTVTGYVQASGLEGRTVTVQLYSAPQNSQAGAGETLEDERRVRLGAEGQVLPAVFDVTPEVQGRRIYTVRVVAPDQDRVPRDNQRTVKVEIVDRTNRVLLMAGGPTREFRFLRNQLFRDRQVTVDVWLQTSQPGASQDADRMLVQFPADTQQMFQYDCVVAFDPDWQQVDQQQLQLLERWVAEQAGGLILIAGPVDMPKWTLRARGDRRFEPLMALCPVVFYSRASSALGGSYFGSETAWPLRFTEEGQQASFLWLADTPLVSEQAWASFPGVYGFYTVRGSKPGATVYARFSDPQTTIDGTLPVYLVGQFYGAGRVFYQGSGEMWRLRAVDESYFQQYYTKLIRYVSQGRLLRDSRRGILLVDKPRCLLGETVIVRASLTDAQFRPLQLPEVPAVLVDPAGGRRRLVLRQVQDAARAGMYAGQFNALVEGDYQIQLAIPQAEEDNLLTREVRVRVPQLELEHPQRDDALLSDMARRTGGAYYVGIPAVLGHQGAASLPSVIEPQDQQTYLPGTPDRLFQQRLMAWLMILICGALSLEWLVRRLNRLA